MVRVSPPRRTTGFRYSATILLTSSKWLPVMDSAAAPQLSGSLETIGAGLVVLHKLSIEAIIQ
ncbi:hypothetical protein F8388_007523 [Cannabis sativa]|uniref:Uncharacterized protein n=1 Tax=Cannabis sativa TaxID=3483 RepID=A0A7J6F7I1_CANSA|nr:hypothetical protein F8388_007523 [Cannabis sativa]